MRTKAGKKQASDTKTLPWRPPRSQLPLYHPPSHERPLASHPRPFHGISNTSAVLMDLAKYFLNCQVPFIKCSLQLYPRMVASEWVSREMWTETHGALGIMSLSTVL